MAKRMLSYLDRNPSRAFEILQFIRNFCAKNHYNPSIREVGEAIGLTSTSNVSWHLTQLTELGMLAGEIFRSRTIHLTEQGLKQLATWEAERATQTE